MSKLKICVSDRCFFPKSAFMSSKAVVKLAKSLGYEQVEFHPTWAVWFEALTKGKLSCQSSDICSFHINWREDGRKGGFGFIKRAFLIPAYWVFPPECLSNLTLQKLEKKYRKPVVVHWREDFDRYRYPIAELHGLLRLNLERVEEMIKNGQIMGVVIDTEKFDGWLEKTGEKESQTLGRLLPFIKEVHFRFRNKEEVEFLLRGKESKSAQLMMKLVKRGYKNQVVVEIGWPEKGAMEILKAEGFERVHKKIINFLKNL
jgi:hypothetical protein